MSVERNGVGGELRGADELYTSIHSFVTAEVEQKTEQLLQKVANKVHFNGAALENSEEFSVGFLDHLDGLAKYSEFLNNDDPDKILFLENGEKRDLEFLLLKKVAWIYKLETTIRQVSQDSGFPLPAKLSHDDLDNWQLHMTTKLSNGGTIVQVTTKQMENILQREVAVDTLCYHGSVPLDTKSQESFNIPVQSLGGTGLSNDDSLVILPPDPLGMEVCPDLRPLHPLGETVTNPDTLKAVSPKLLSIAEGLPASTSSSVNGNSKKTVKQRKRRSTSGPTIPTKQKGKYAETNVKHDRDKSCPLGLSCVCGFKGVKRRDLNEHVKKMTMEWKYPCDACGVYFFHESLRTQHYKLKLRICKLHQQNPNVKLPDGSRKYPYPRFQRYRENSVALDKKSGKRKSGQSSQGRRKRASQVIPSGTSETADQQSKSDLDPVERISQGSPDENPDSGEAPTVNTGTTVLPGSTIKVSPGAVQQPNAEPTLTTSGSEATSFLNIQSTNESGETVAINNTIGEFQSSAEQIVSAHQEPSDPGSNNKSKEISTGESFAMETFAQSVPSGNQCVTQSPIQIAGRNRKRKRQRRQERLKLGRCGIAPRSSDEWKFKCSLCPKTFYGFEQLKEHLSKGHGRDNEYPRIIGGCERCGEMFTNPEEWCAHRRGDRSLDVLPGMNVSKRIRQWVESSPEVLENISDDFSSETDPNHALTTIQQNENCDVDVDDSRGDTASVGPSPHLEAEPIPTETSAPRSAPPTGEKPMWKGKKGKRSRSEDDWKFICQVCPRKFEHLSKLKEHLRKHGVENPYPEHNSGCSYCGQMFLKTTTKSDIVSHRKDCRTTGETQRSHVLQGAPDSNETIRGGDIKVEPITAVDNQQEGSPPRIDQIQPEESVRVKEENVEQNAGSKSAEVEIITISDDEV